VIEKGWEHFSHEADMGVRGFGASKEEAFEQVAVAMMHVITDSEIVESKEETKVVCEAPDDELLLADWLNALIYEMSIQKIIFGRFKVNITGQHLEGQAWGEKVDPVRHQPAVEVKGATYTMLKVKQESNGRWVAQCVVDV
jgi:SHS2 domain-containing protein